MECLPRYTAMNTDKEMQNARITSTHQRRRRAAHNESRNTPPYAAMRGCTARAQRKTRNAFNNLSSSRKPTANISAGVEMDRLVRYGSANMRDVPATGTVRNATINSEP